VALLVVLLVSGAPDFGVGQLVAATGAYGAAMLIGWTMQTRRARIDTFEEEQEESARRAVADERLRIAQELHDVVAHSLGVIAVQSGVGMHVIDSDPDEARRAFESISRTSRTSLTEIRRLLGMMRDVEGAPAYSPAPGLVDLPRLVEGVTHAGLTVDVTINGSVDDVPPGVGLAAYRIVQEALTNTLRHAHAHAATVRLDSRPGELAVEVVDDGRGPNGARPGGHGLVGMRERVAVYGGALEASRGTEGGFRIAARLPYEAAPA
jgi:signal transduction histidine kinase